MINFDRNFVLWAFTVSHNFLILRSPKEFPDMNNYSSDKDFNIDIEFSSVSYVELPCKLKTPSLRLIKDEIPEKFKDFVLNQRQKLIEIWSDNQVYYIVASGFQIGKNQWIEDDRAMNPLLKHDNVIIDEE